MQGATKRHTPPSSPRPTTNPSEPPPRAYPSSRRAGEELVSRAVNALIHSPLYAPMKFLARAAMKQTAARCGVDWDAEAGRMMADPEVRGLRGALMSSYLVLCIAARTDEPLG